MKSEQFFNRYFSLIAKSVSAIDPSLLESIAVTIQDVSKQGGKIIIVGNGGSAAMASHVAVDFAKVAKIRAINFNEPDLITCYANDYGYENWVSEALQSYADKKDLVILISSSGKSANIINGALKAKAIGMKSISLSGFDSQNPLRNLGDFNLWVDSSLYNIVEMTHHIWLLAIVDYLAELQV